MFVFCFKVISIGNLNGKALLHVELKTKGFETSIYEEITVDIKISQKKFR